MKRFVTLATSAILATFCGCSDTKEAPKGIDADGTIYVACRGLVTISGNMQEGYEIRFTDVLGMDHDVRGIHKLEVADLPDKSVCEPTKADGSSSKGVATPTKDAVSEACKEARANGTSTKWNEEKQKFEINPVCEQ
jgi:hypothetical protein